MSRPTKASRASFVQFSRKFTSGSTCQLQSGSTTSSVAIFHWNFHSNPSDSRRPTDGTGVALCRFTRAIQWRRRKAAKNRRRRGGCIDCIWIKSGQKRHRSRPLEHAAAHECTSEDAGRHGASPSAADVIVTARHRVALCKWAAEWKKFDKFVQTGRFVQKFTRRFTLGLRSGGYFHPLATCVRQMVPGVAWAGRDRSLHHATDSWTTAAPPFLEINRSARPCASTGGWWTTATKSNSVDHHLLYKTKFVAHSRDQPLARYEFSKSTCPATPQTVKRLMKFTVIQRQLWSKYD